MKIYKRFVFTQLMILMGIASSFAQEDLNVLVFLVDDLRPDLACYGNELMQSPNIDKLAEDGVMFKNAYAQQAICAPSRMSILTGLRPETFAIYDIFTRFDRTHPEALTLTSLFNENGYKTVSIGKVFHHGNDGKGKWDVYHGKEGNSYHIPGNDTLKPAYEGADVDDNAYKDGRSAQKAIQTLNQLKNEKFMMVVGLSKPHLPFNAPKKYWDMYKREDFKIPVKQNPTGYYEAGMAKWGELRGYGNIPESGYLNDSLTLDLINGYYACVSYIDAQVGKVMQTLDDLDLRKNTIVVFMSDHGYKLGEFGAWCKHTNYDIDINVPLIISRETSHPNRKTNVQTNAIVENVDLLPTLAEACGIDIPQRDGKSLIPLLDKPEMEWSNVAYSLYAHGKVRMGVTCTDGEYRYVEWRNFDNNKLWGVELYPTNENYMERSVNLAELAQYDSIEASMKALLHKHYPLNNRPYGQANMPEETIIDTAFNFGFENLTDGEIIEIGADLTVEAKVGSAFTAVALWLGDTNMGTLTSAPFKWVLSDLAEKSHKLKLVATGGEGIIATDSITVIVSDYTFEGTPIGTPDAFCRTNENVATLFDGDVKTALNTQSDARNNVWAGIDFGEGVQKKIIALRLALRVPDNPANAPLMKSRLQGAKIYGANTVSWDESGQSNDVTADIEGNLLHEITAEDLADVNLEEIFKITVEANTDKAYRYVLIFFSDGSFGNCAEFGVYTEDMVNSINEAKAVNNGVTIYPNPVTGVLYFKGANFINAKVSTLSGQMIKSVPVLKNQVDVSQLEKGMYLIQLWGEQGLVYTGRFVKE